MKKNETMKQKSIYILIMFLITIGTVKAQTPEIYKDFLKAIEDNNLPKVKELIKKGADPDYCYYGDNWYFYPPVLNIACNVQKADKTKLEIIKTILDNGAYVSLDLLNKAQTMYSVDEKIIDLLKKKFIEQQNQFLSSENALIRKELIIMDRLPLTKTHFSDNQYLNEITKKIYFSYEDSKNIDLQRLLLNSLLNPDFIHYDSYDAYSNWMSNTISKNEILEKFDTYSDTIYVPNPDTGLPDTVLNEHLPDKNEITGLVFYDKWDFDEKNFKMYKEVKAYAPIRQYIPTEYSEVAGTNYRYKLLAWFIFYSDMNKKEKKESDKNLKLIKKMKYEFYLENSTYAKFENTNSYDKEYIDLHLENENSPFWTSYGRERFREIIIDRVTSGIAPAYDFFTNEELSINKIEDCFGVTVDTVYKISPDTGEKIKVTYKTKINNTEIKSVVFLEHWYIDEKTMRIVKKVIGVAPIRTYYSYLDKERINPHKQVAFVVYFDENERY